MRWTGVTEKLVSIGYLYPLAMMQKGISRRVQISLTRDSDNSILPENACPHLLMIDFLNFFISKYWTLRVKHSNPNPQSTPLSHQISSLTSHSVLWSFHTDSSHLFNSLSSMNQPFSLNSYPPVLHPTKPSNPPLLGQLSHLFGSCIYTLGAEKI